MMKDMSLCEGEASEISAACRKRECVCVCLEEGMRTSDVGTRRMSGAGGMRDTCWLERECGEPVCVFVIEWNDYARMSDAS